MTFQPRDPDAWLKATSIRYLRRAYNNGEFKGPMKETVKGHLDRRDVLVTRCVHIAGGCVGAVTAVVTVARAFGWIP